MNDNPFQPPSAERTHAIPPGRFDLGDAITDGWNGLRRSFPTCAGVWVVAILLMTLSAFTIIGAFFVIPPIAWGLARYLLNVQDGHGAFDDLWDGFRNYRRALGSFLMLLLLNTCISIPASSVQYVGLYLDDPIVMLIGQAVYYAVLLVLMPRFYFAPFLIIDQGMGGLDAFKGSWAMTRGQWMMIAILGVLSSIISSLGLLLCCVGILVSAHMAYLMYASAYRQCQGITPQADDDFVSAAPREPPQDSPPPPPDPFQPQ